MSFFITLLETTDTSRREFEAIPKMTDMLNHGLTLAEYRASLARHASVCSEPACRGTVMSGCSGPSCPTPV